MGIFDQLFRREVQVNVTLNGPIMPMDRGAYEDLVEATLKKLGKGRLGAGGGTRLSPEGKPVACDFDLLIKPDFVEDLRKLLDASFFVPKGSKMTVGDAEYPIGQQEGVAVKLARSEIDADGMTETMVNQSIGALNDALGDRGTMLSVTQDEAGAELYFYGPDRIQLTAAIQAELPKHPLFSKAILYDIESGR